MKYGYVKTAMCSPAVRLGDTAYNAEQIKKQISDAAAKKAEIIMFGEKSITGFSLKSMERYDTVLGNAKTALEDVAECSKNIKSLIVVGLPLETDGGIVSAAALIFGGKIYGFAAGGRNESVFSVSAGNAEIPVCREGIFELPLLKTKIGVVFGEDFDGIRPCAARLARSGAEIILNMSAGKAFIGSHKNRNKKIEIASQRLMCAYAYASAGAGESVDGGVYGGDRTAAENGLLIADADGGTEIVYAEFDTDAIKKARSFSEFETAPVTPCASIPVKPSQADVTRPIDPLPFVPESDEFPRIFDIMGRAIYDRMTSARTKRVMFGLSGGLDSTMVLVACEKTFAKYGLDKKDIIAVTMSGFGSSNRTKNNARDLIDAFGVTNINIPIADAVAKHLEDIGHDGKKDIVYENAQARERAQILLDLANKYGALLLGTGDLSEIALGWSTYGGDQLAHFNPNSSASKTLIRAAMRNYCLTSDNADAARIINDVLATPVSPELIPGQVTEDVIGPYELHDFYLYNLIGKGFSAEKTVYLACRAFPDFPRKTIIKHLKTFVKRFFSNRFKQNASCDGVPLSPFDLSEKIISSDFSGELFIKEIERLEQPKNS